MQDKRPFPVPQDPGETTGLLVERLARGRDAGRSLLGAISTYRRNEPAASFTALGRVPRERRGVSYFLFRAGLLSSVGRVREAEAALTEVGQADPKSGEVSALRSGIALVRDHQAAALRLADAGA